MDIISDSGLLGCSPAKSPIEQNLRLHKSIREFLSNPTSYHRLVGRFFYFKHTRLDISFAVQKLSHFMDQPRICHMETATRVLLRYLKATPDQGLLFPFMDVLNSKASLIQIGGLVRRHVVL